MPPAVLILSAALSLLSPARTAAGPDPAPAPDAVFRIDGNPIGAELFREYLSFRGEGELKGRSLEHREFLAREFAVDWKLAADARSRRLDRSDEFLSQMERFDLKHLPDAYFREEFLAKTSTGEDDFLSHFADLVDRADVGVLVASTREEAEGYLRRIGAGEDFAALVRDSSGGRGGSSGGLATGVTAGDVRFSLEEKNAILSSSTGAVLGPFENKLGSYSLIRIRSLRSVEQQKEEIREKRGEEVRQKKARAAYLSRINEEMARSEIEINEEYFTGADKGKAKRPYLAWVKGKYIYPPDVGSGSDPHGGHGKPTARESRAKLDEAIRSVIAADLAKQQGIDRSPAYRAKREAAGIATLSDLLVRKEADKAKLAASKKEIQEFYRKNYQPEAYWIFVVTNRDPEQVRKALEELRAGGPPAKVAASRSDDPSRLREGIVGPFPLGQFDPAVAERIGTVPAGEYTEPFPMGGKYAVVRLVEKKAVPVPPLSEVEERIGERVVRQKRADLVAGRRKAALRDVSLVIDAETLSAVQ